MHNVILKFNSRITIYYYNFETSKYTDFFVKYEELCETIRHNFKLQNEV